MKSHSQFGEDLIFVPILVRTLGIEKGHVTDIGAGDGRNMSNARALIELGWSADLYDGDPKGAPDVEKIWVTPEGIIHKVNPGVDFLSLDIDGCDYWVMEAILTRTYARPSLILVEINPRFQRHDPKTIPYDENHRWQQDQWYGCSLAAYEKLMGAHGYTLMYLHKSLNAFFLRNDHAEAHPELVQPIEYQQKFDHKPHSPEKEVLWITV